MSTTPPPPENPSPLDKFPAEVREAYQRFRATGDTAALHVLVYGTLRDFIPSKKADGAPPLRDDLRLVEDLGFDSLAIAEMVFFFEDLFQLTINNAELQTVVTVGDVQTFVVRKLAEKPAPS